MELHDVHGLVMNLILGQVSQNRKILHVDDLWRQRGTCHFRTAITTLTLETREDRADVDTKSGPAQTFRHTSMVRLSISGRMLGQGWGR